MFFLLTINLLPFSTHPDPSVGGESPLLLCVRERFRFLPASPGSNSGTVLRFTQWKNQDFIIIKTILDIYKGKVKISGVMIQLIDL